MARLWWRANFCSVMIPCSRVTLIPLFNRIWIIMKKTFVNGPQQQIPWYFSVYAYIKGRRSSSPITSIHIKAATPCNRHDGGDTHSQYLGWFFLLIRKDGRPYNKLEVELNSVPYNPNETMPDFFYVKCLITQKLDLFVYFNNSGRCKMVDIIMSINRWSI